MYGVARVAHPVVEYIRCEQQHSVTSAMDVKREPLGGSVLTQSSCPDGVGADMISKEIMDRRCQAVAYGDAHIMCVYVCVCVCMHVCV